MSKPSFPERVSSIEMTSRRFCHYLEEPGNDAEELESHVQSVLWRRPLPLGHLPSGIPAEERSGDLRR